jgi:hypothetical protein
MQARRLEEERATARLLRWDIIDPPRVVERGELRKPPEDTTHSPSLNTGGRAHVHHRRTASDSHPTSSQTKRESSRPVTTDEDKEKNARNKLRRHRRTRFDERRISEDSPDARTARKNLTSRIIAPASETEGGRERSPGHTRYSDGILVTDHSNERSSTQPEGTGATTSERGSYTGRKAKIHYSDSTTKPIAKASSTITGPRLRDSDRRSPSEKATSKGGDRVRSDAGASRTVRSRRHHQGKKSNKRSTSP